MARYIDADALLEDIRKNSMSYFADDFAHEWVDKQPTADVRENKRGEWVNGKCNQCGAHAPYWPMSSAYYESNYCPDCGAAMQKEVNP